MGRHTADIMARLTVRVPRGQQGFWEVIRELHRKRGRWTAKDVDGSSNVHLSTVHDYLRRLTQGGFIARDGEIKGHIAFRLLIDQPEAPRLRRDGKPVSALGQGQDQMWRTMKMMARFDARDLALHATTSDATVTLETARTYLRHLYRVGYLTVVEPGRPTGHRGRHAMTVYRLIPSMNTGPLAPQIQRADFVWDPNRKKVMGSTAPAVVGVR